MAGPAVLTVADTIARSFLLAVQTRGDRPAIREKKFGIWQPTSWREWLQISRDIAYALHATGFRPGDVASIIANAVPEWVYADMGILCAGGVSSGIYPTDAPAQVERAVTPRTRAILPVHLYGRPADMSPIREIASRHGLRVLEDAAEPAFQPANQWG